MRTLNSGKNFLVTVSLMVTMTLLGFVTRKLFVNEIGVEYPVSYTHLTLPTNREV